MASINKVMIMGNITCDVDLRYTPGGSAVTNITLALNRKKTDDEGNKTEETDYVDVTLWGKAAELVKTHSSKGSRLFIEGRLCLDKWVDADSGNNRTKLKVVAQNVTFTGSRPRPGVLPAPGPEHDNLPY